MKEIVKIVMYAVTILAAILLGFSINQDSEQGIIEVVIAIILPLILYVEHLLFKSNFKK